MRSTCPQPKGQRIQNVMFHGAPLQDDQELTLAVNNYRCSSALKAQSIISGTKEWESSNSIRDMIVAYFAEHSPVAPEVDHNWKIVGVDLSEDDPRRAELVGYINAGLLDTPYAESYNLSDYDSLVAQAKAKAETLTVTVNGAAKDVATAFDAQGNTYYRLRDLAFALKGTGAQFNVTWGRQCGRRHRLRLRGRGPGPARLRPHRRGRQPDSHRGRHCGEPARRTRQRQLLSGRRLPRPAGRGVRPGGGRFGHHRPRNRFPSAKGRAWGAALSLRILPDSARALNDPFPSYGRLVQFFSGPFEQSVI